MLLNELEMHIYQDVIIYTIDTNTDKIEVIYNGKLENAPGSILDRKVRVIGVYDKNIMEISVH